MFRHCLCTFFLLRYLPVSVFFFNNSCDTFLQELKKYGVTTVVRVCEATYDATLVVKEGIQVLVSSGLQNLHDHQCIEPNSMQIFTF